MTEDEAWEAWQEGNRCYTLELFEKAIDAFGRAIDMSPNVPQYRFNRALALAQTHQYNRAIDDLHYVAELAPGDAEVRYLLGIMRWRLGESALATLNFRASLGRDPHFGPSRAALSALSSSDGSAKDPLLRLPELRSRESSHVESELDSRDNPRTELVIPSVADVARPGSEETLVVAVERSLRQQIEPTDRRDTMRRAVLLSALHRREAGPLWESLVDDVTPQVEALRLAVRAFAEAGEWDEVLRVLADRPNPQSDSLARYRARAMLSLGRPVEAAAVLDSVPAPSAETLRALTGIRLALGDRAGAIAEAQAALSAAPSSPLMRSVWAVAETSWFSCPRPLDDLQGLREVKETVRERIVLPLLLPELYLSGPSMNKFLLTGPPGCGKTSLARAAAREAHAEFRLLHLTSVLNMYTGNSEGNLTAFFKEVKDAAESGPVVVLLDEVDSVARARHATDQAGEHRMVTHLMSELDQIRHLPSISVLATTNVPFDLDPAVLRSGRLGSPIYVGPPNAHDRERLIQRELVGLPHATVDARRLAATLEWYSPADIEQVFSSLRYRAKTQLLVKSDHQLTQSEISESFRSVSPTVKVWLAKVRLRRREDPSIAPLIGAELSRDLERLEFDARALAKSGDARDQMFG